ncbi:hypothetical protein RUE5091_02134 [Ruegeria denitrificans]|uniref:Prokaryotic phospholipase A2 n=1 Tax=Ruegeria denitrificans TaxID=1715692 RepID=A0A0P1I9V8_9RHOB|nr:hypothetical protein [Ruegeria denitrificans]CUK00469.1 hypothetical protein RUE5091_02134 [Ruegeria denitrificans]
MKAPKLAGVLALVAAPATAQEFMRNLEMPAHRALIAQRGDAEVIPFETDGCSGGLSASWRFVAETFPKFSALYEAHPPWEYCCVTHDRAYHNAGGASHAEQSFDARLSADDALRACVKQHGEDHAADYAQRYDMTPDQIRTAHFFTAEAMHTAVRLGGGPCSGLPWRWGFGYPGCSVFQSGAPARE